MNKIHKLIAFLLVLACVCLPTSTVYAKGLQGGRVIFGDNFTLESGDTLTGDLVVIGGNVTIEADATVEGDMVVVGGNVTQDGTIEGSVVIIGGTVIMGEASLVEGDLVTVGGWLERAPGAQVEGDVIANIPAPDFQIPDMPSPPALPEIPEVPTPPEIPDLPTPPSPPEVRTVSNPLVEVVRMFATAFAVALLAMLGSLFLQPQLERVSQAIVKQPLIAGSFGLLTTAMAPFVLLILAVTFILIPVALLAATVLALAWLFGVIAIGTEIGERFTRSINQSWSYPLVAGFGTFLLMLVLGVIFVLNLALPGIVCAGWMLIILLSLLGIGGVTLTLFGSRPYPSVVLPSAPASSEGAGG